MGFYCGDISKIEEETVQNFKDSSIYHVLAVSGTHVRFYTCRDKLYIS